MDPTNRDGGGSVDGSLDETLPSTDSGQGAHRETRSTGEQGAIADLGIERGAEIGRYVVLEPLGSGTMGLVVAAYDPTLDRKVAIKVVRLDPTGTTSGRQRLIREAQAMAKLQHPNVVTVFEVGTFGDQLFLAMEYVAGTTLGDWLKAGRTKREIVAAFVAAGHGLAAAHRAGIVHRDFKPANVLVDNDGRVRVADFGLATATDAPPPPVSQSISRDSDPGPLGMTKTGAVLGTPAYMSPEQYLGEVADARADQYSFCVALYEALYRELPFEGTTFLVYRDNVISGRVRDAPKDSSVPARIRRALLRGLSAAPDDRYPDVDRLLDDVARDRGIGRVALAGGAAAVAAGVVIALFARGSGGGGGDPCAAADQPIAAVWTAVQRAALERSFVATGSPGAPAAFKRIAAALDQRVDQLRAARREACVATAVRHEQSEELHERRIACVDQRAVATGELIDVLVDHHDPETLAKGMQAVLGLPPVEPCADRASLLAADTSQPPPPIRAKVAELEHQLDRIEAMSNAGVWMKAAVELERVVPRADQVSWAATAARAHQLSAVAFLHLENTERAVVEFRKAGELAAAAHDDRQVASAWIGLYAAVGYRLGHVDEARGLEPATAAAVVRAGNSPLLQGQLENSRGLIAMGADDYLGAAKHFQAGADLLTKAGHSRIADVADALSNEGTTLTWAEHYDEARVAHEKALAIRIETLGAEHPSVGDSYYGLGVLYDNMGDPERALEQFRKSAAISERAYPPDSTNAAKDLVSIGLVLGELEQRDAAIDALEHAVATFEKHGEETKHEISTVLFDLGMAYLNVHRTKDALATMQRALVSAEVEHGKESEEVAAVLGGMLAAADTAGQHETAREYGERALAIREKVGGSTSQAVARVLGDLADNAISRKDLPAAMKLIDRALAIMTAPGAPPLAVKYTMLLIRANAEIELGRADAAIADARSARDGYAEAQQPTAAAGARVILANALWLKGGAQPRRDALVEAKAALETLQAQPKPDATEVANAKAWLAAHR